MSSGASARATLRRLLRVASRYDVERPHLKALFPSPSARGDTSESTTLRDLVRRTALDPAGHGLPVADPPRAHALVRRNLDALETVMRRAEAQTAVQRRDARARASGVSAPKRPRSDASLVSGGERLARPRLEMADAVRRAIDATLRDASAERLASITHDANAEPWLRRAGARETRRRRARDDDESSRAPRAPSSFRKSHHPNAAWYADRLDDALESDRIDRADRIERLFREATAVGCPPPPSDVARAMVAMVAETTSPKSEERDDSFQTGVRANDDDETSDACRSTPLVEDDACREHGVDAALRLAWTFGVFEDEDEENEDFVANEKQKSCVARALDAVVFAAARRAAEAPPFRSGHSRNEKFNRTVRVINLLHAHMDVCGSKPGRDAAAEAVAVAARFVADDARRRRTTHATRRARDEDGSESESESPFKRRVSSDLTYERLALTVARLESMDVGVAPRARRAVLAAAERASGLDEAFDAMRRWKRSGGSPDADAVLGLLEWAVEAGDDEKVSWLEEELAATGKGAYLASLNSPVC